jgi:hypothetical protein
MVRQACLQDYKTHHQFFPKSKQTLECDMGKANDACNC